VKPVRIWIYFGGLVIGLFCGLSPLAAQPASKPVPTDVDPDPTKDDLDLDDEDAASANDKTIVTDDDNKPWSQGVSAEERKVARKLFLEGNRLFRIPLFAKAAEQYMAALSKWKHPAFYFNLALAQLNLSKEIDARENLERALQHGEEPLGVEQYQEAQKQLKEVRRQLGQLRVICRTPGAEVTLDGVTLFIGPGSYQGWTKAKTHEITAKKAGYLSEARSVTVRSEGIQDVDLKLVTLSEATDASRRWATWKPWAVVAAGGSITAIGGGLHVLASRNFNDFDKEFLALPCVTTNKDLAVPGCPKDDIPSTLNDRLSLAKTQQTIAVGAYVVGGSLMVVGAVLLYLNRPQLIEQRATRLSAGSVSAIPVVSADLLGVLVKVGY